MVLKQLLQLTRDYHLGISTVACYVGCFDMALREVTNTGNGYIVQIKLVDEYAPLVSRGKNLGTQAPHSSYLERREAGRTNIDLWIDGQLYPTDPSTKRPPPFSTVKEYLEFVCKGENGMLGYIKRLRTDENGYRGGESVQSLESTVFSLRLRVTNYEFEIQELRLCCQELEGEAGNFCSTACLTSTDSSFTTTWSYTVLEHHLNFWICAFHTLALVSSLCRRASLAHGPVEDGFTVI